MPITNSKSNAHTGESDLTHSMAHYLLAIHKLKERKGYARVTDIAKELNLTKGSVSTAINNLKKKGLVFEEDDSKFLNLSHLGHEEVHQILSTRTLLYYFLKDFLGVENEVAQNDSCLMEHLMSESTRIKFFQFMKDLSCTCHRTSQDTRFKTTLDLCSFKNVAQFLETQKGDSYLIDSPNQDESLDV